ncbi:MAG: acyl--CoA ligase [Bacilli bacterium]|nr:acyl--CoA ligase [Bacilli bacterium]
MKVNPNQSKYNYMLENSMNHMNNIALTYGNKKISYEEMFESINRYAKLLYSKGVRKGDLIGICTLNTPEAVYLIYALNKIGAVAIGYNFFDNKERIKNDVELTGPKMIITTDYSYSSFKDLEKSLNISTITYSPFDYNNLLTKFGYNLMLLKKGQYIFDKEKKLKHLLKNDFSNVAVPINQSYGEELSDIIFTGGSTGVHKGVDLNDVGLNSEIEGMKQLYDENFFDEKIYLGQIPFGHMAFGRSILHAALTNNMTYALTLKAMPKDFYDELVRTKAHGASGGPPHWTSLIEMKNGIYVPKSNLKPNSLNNLQVAFSGGEAKKEATEKAINDALLFCGSKTKLGDGLGATETWGSNILNTGNYFKEGALGVPLPNLKIKLINPETGKQVANGEKGLLYLSGPSIMMGYHNNLKETDKVISYDENGIRWLNLGDYLSNDSDGFYRYVGRQKRNFVCGCDNIYPEQIEELLQTFPEVREAVVTPISDDLLQFVPIYHISLYSDQINYEEFEKKMKKAIENKICASALPMKIEYFTEPLVRMMNAKIDIEYYKKRDVNLKEKVLELKK